MIPEVALSPEKKQLAVKHIKHLATVYNDQPTDPGSYFETLSGSAAFAFNALHTLLMHAQVILPHIHHMAEGGMASEADVIVLPQSLIKEIEGFIKIGFDRIETEQATAREKGITLKNVLDQKMGLYPEQMRGVIQEMIDHVTGVKTMAKGGEVAEFAVGEKVMYKPLHPHDPYKEAEIAKVTETGYEVKHTKSGVVYYDTVYFSEVGQWLKKMEQEKPKEFFQSFKGIRFSSGDPDIEKFNDVRELMALAYNSMDPKPTYIGPSKEQLSETLTSSGVYEIVFNTWSAANGWTIKEIKQLIEPVPAPTQKAEAIRSEKEGKDLLYSFFTPDPVCEMMWAFALANCDNKTHPRVLEPAFGNGQLIKYVPDKSLVTGFETSQEYFDATKKLFPDASLYHGEFTTSFLKPPRFTEKFKGGTTWIDGFPFDIAIANPPYGDMKESRYLTLMDYVGHTKKTKAVRLELFFMYWSLFLLKPNGVGVFCVPSNILRTGSSYNDVKKEISIISNLIDMVRIPDKYFSNTSIGVDILVFKRK